MHTNVFRSAFARTVLIAALGAAAVFATTSSAAVSGGVDKAAEALVPASIKSKGTLIVAADATYALNEFIGSDGHTVIGMDADLAKAIGAAHGPQGQRRERDLRHDHPGPGRQESSTSARRRSPIPRRARRSSTSWTTSTPAPRSSSKRSVRPEGDRPRRASAASRSSVETGTTEQTDAQGQATKCARPARSVTVLAFPTQTPPNLAISSGRAQLSAWPTRPSPPTRSSSPTGKFKLVGQYLWRRALRDRAPEGGRQLTRADPRRAQGLIANGTYSQDPRKVGVVQAPTPTRPSTVRSTEPGGAQAVASRRCDSDPAEPRRPRTSPPSRSAIRAGGSRP